MFLIWSGSGVSSDQPISEGRFLEVHEKMKDVASAAAACCGCCHYLKHHLADVLQQNQRELSAAVSRWNHGRGCRDDSSCAHTPSNLLFFYNTILNHHIFSLYISLCFYFIQIFLKKCFLSC